jgi:predicted membrane protein
MARLRYSGYVVAIFLALVLYLFGITNISQTVSALFLFIGLWTIALGLNYKGERMYYTGWGVCIAVLSTFVVLPLSYTVGLVLIAIIAMILINAMLPRRSTKVLPQQADLSK